MSLQPGPQDSNDESSLTPEVPLPDPDHSAPAPEAAMGDSPQPAGQQPPSWPAPPVQPPPAPGWAAPPPPAEGWAAPPPPAPAGYGYPSSPPLGGPGPGQIPDYPPPGYPPAGYQAIGYGTPSQTDSKAVVGLILAISSWIVCPLITAVVALVLAGQSNRAIDASSGRLEGRSLNTATKVIAWINIVLSILAILALAVVMIFAVTTDSTIITDISDQSTQF